MVKNKGSQKMLATLFALVYLFVALFSQNFHEHGSGVVFKDFQIKKSEKSFTTSSTVANYSDCLSCHILHDGKFVNFSEISFSAISAKNFQSEITSPLCSTTRLEISFVYLRGPPLFFI